MRLSEVEVGQQYTYYPQQDANDNLHAPAVVVAVTKARVRIQTPLAEKPITISAKRLTTQLDLLGIERPIFNPSADAQSRRAA